MSRIISTKRAADQLVDAIGALIRAEIAHERCDLEYSHIATADWQQASNRLAGVIRQTLNDITRATKWHAT